MKIIKTISIDNEVWIKAKQRTENISGTINFLLNRWVETEAEEYERNKIETMKTKLEQQQAEMAILQKQLEDIKKRENDNKILRSFEGRP